MGTGDGNVVGITKIVDHGDPSQRWNLVILSEGYQAGQLDQFHNDAQNFVKTMYQTPPYDEMWCGINVYRIDVSSTDSGAADPKGCGGTGYAPHTYFDATFCGDGVIQRLLTVNDGTVHSVVNAQMPQAHMSLVIVNSTEYGGSGGSVVTFSLAGGADEIALHEMGHTAFGFADEYCYYQGCGIDVGHDHYGGGEPGQPNITANSNRATIKWATSLRAVSRSVRLPDASVGQSLLCRLPAGHSTNSCAVHAELGLRNQYHSRWPDTGLVVVVARQSRPRSDRSTGRYAR